ncbi:NAD(P)H-dependent dehydrogenase/reductase [Candidatus Vecturithrix granuli]|uniref:NAD(P)H-dependent dehydrogenase/reductase n=1 Tax=Vecturithrix granuli TaxID=1499967 RepID=A0A081C4C8_VECG1|nr:NAD(P)H-dependent dehydrogenase/reductase [Candidatus Vecturithrix granuli]
MLSLLQARRSIRRYTQQRPDQDVIDTLKEAVLRSPSSRGLNPWEFVFVDQPDLLAQLASAKPHGSAFLQQAALGVVVCGDERQTDVWVEDCSIASIILQLAAHAIGLGTCWIQIRNRTHNDTTSAEQYVQRLLHLPEYLRVESIISIGYPDEQKEPHPTSSLEYGKIHLNQY